MKRLYGVLLLVLAALMFFSCKREPAFEPDPILTETTVGVYGLSGANHVYKPLECQLSRTYDANGALTLRILSREDGSVCQVSPIQADAAKGEHFEVKVLCKTAEKTLSESTLEVEVLEVGKELLWLKAREGTVRMVVKK